MKRLIYILSLLALVLVLIPSIAFTQEEIVCGETVTVQANDSLSTLAEQFYGDTQAYTIIAQATNAKAATDDSYATIDDINVLEIGWQLCIPAAEDVEDSLSQLASAEPATDTGSSAGISAPTGVSDAASAVPVAPDVDRVGFPEGYQETFSIFYEFDRIENKSARVIYANEAAASAQAGQPYPYGSILVMEVYRTEQDDEGNVLLDENGRFLRGDLFGLFLMRKEPGFGVKYGDLRNGEWEYVAYRPDGSVLVPPEGTQGCAACHLEAGQVKDWVFRAERHFEGEAAITDPTPEENQIVIFDYKFLPDTLTVEAGTEVTWVNNDVLINTATADDLSFNSRAIRVNASFSHTFEEPGTYTYFSVMHPNMKGMVVVTE